jgi:hypothetical protein
MGHWLVLRWFIGARRVRCVVDVWEGIGGEVVEGRVVWEEPTAVAGHRGRFEECLELGLRELGKLREAG